MVKILAYGIAAGILALMLFLYSLSPTGITILYDQYGERIPEMVVFGLGIGLLCISLLADLKEEVRR